MSLKRLSIADIIKLSDKYDEKLLFGQFLDDFKRADNKQELISEEPIYIENKKIRLCILAATAHKLANYYNLIVPKWTLKNCYIYPENKYGLDTKNIEYQKYLIETSPIEFKIRNLYFGDNILSRV